MYQLKISIRSLLFRKAQYKSLFLVCMFGVAASLTALFINRGMINAMNEKAKIYYGGNYAFMEDDAENGLQIINYKDYYNKIRKIFPPEAIVSYRFDLDGRKVSLYFEGTQALQQTIKGCDFELEKKLFNNMKLISGSFDSMKGSNGIVISRLIAEMLNVKVGDVLTFMIDTVNDGINTVGVEVKGIFQDSSVFGMYTSYMDFDFLKRCYGRPENFANRIVINFPGKYLNKKDDLYYQYKLEEVFDMFPLVDNKDDFLDREDDSVTKDALIPLSANLVDVKIMDRAMDLIITFIIAILVVIIVAGMGSTYRVLVMKRMNEIGIYMSIGMKKKSIATILLFESLVLVIAGCIAAFFLTGLFCFIISLFNFSFIPSFDLFLVKGNLLPSVDVIKSIIVIAVVILFTLLAVLYSTWKSIKVLPVKALSAVE